MNIGEAEDAPTGQGGLVVFLHVGDEARSAVVASVDPDAAFDLTRSLPLVSPFGLPAAVLRAPAPALGSMRVCAREGGRSQSATCALGGTEIPVRVRSPEWRARGTRSAVRVGNDGRGGEDADG